MRYAVSLLLILLLAAGCSGSKEAAEEMPMEEPAPAIVGDWSGQLNALGASLRIVFHVTEEPDGSLSATRDSPDQGATGLRVDEVTFDGEQVEMNVRSIGGTYTGTLQDDALTIEGTWMQGGQSFALDLQRDS